MDAYRSNADFAEAWAFWTDRSPAGRVTRDPDLISTWMGTSWPIGNLSFLARAVEDESDLARRIDVVLDRAAGSALGWMFLVCLQMLPESLQASLEPAMAAKGLAAVLPMTGMTAEALLPPVRPLPHLDLVKVRDSQCRRHFAEINAAAYGMPVESVIETLDPKAFWGPDSHGFVGYLDGRPVTTAKTIAFGDLHYIGLVATLPEMQRQGMAERVMRHSIQAAESNSRVRPLVLHATPFGKPLYEQMGFKPMADFVAFAPAQEGGH